MFLINIINVMYPFNSATKMSVCTWSICLVVISFTFWVFEMKQVVRVLLFRDLLTFLINILNYFKYQQSFSVSEEKYAISSLCQKSQLMILNSDSVWFSLSWHIYHVNNDAKTLTSEILAIIQKNVQTLYTWLTISYICDLY